MLGALAQLTAFVVYGYLGALVYDSGAADGSLGCNAKPVGGLDFVFRLGPGWQLLLFAPLVAGLGGALVYWPRRRIAWKAMIGVATAAALAGAIIVQVEGWDVLDPRQVLRPGSGSTVLPFCIALFVIALFVRKDRSVQMTPLT